MQRKGKQIPGWLYISEVKSSARERCEEGRHCLAHRSTDVGEDHDGVA
jgi:hypothetical protein